MSIAYEDCKTGSFICGYTFLNRYASGIITTILPGLGYVVNNDGYQYLIVNKFCINSKMSSNYLSYGVEDSSYICLSDETILFWLKGGIHAKACIYGVEVSYRSLIEPTSDIGLRLCNKVFPFIRPSLYYNGIDSSNEWMFIKKAGIHLPCGDGDSAPRPYGLVFKNEIDKQENHWHLLRSRLLTEEDAMPYKYTFLQCGKKMLITLDGIKKATVNYIGGEVHLYTPSHSAAVSPAKPFILASPPISDMEDIDETDLLWGGDNKFVEAVKRLSDIHMDECIEENYWEMKRIRIAALTNKTSLGEDFINAQKWLDAAYEEKQARRENDLFLYLSINQ